MSKLLVKKRLLTHARLLPAHGDVVFAEQVDEILRNGGRQWNQHDRHHGKQAQRSRADNRSDIKRELAAAKGIERDGVLLEVFQDRASAALDFIRANELDGNLLVFFDWGEMCIWELPQSPVSIDGRLDTCYPREVISAHWKFYNNEPFDQNILNLEKADFALLPANVAGAFALAKKPGWKAVYFDGLAVVLVRNVERFPKLFGKKLPIEGEKAASMGREPFPDKISMRLIKTQ